ncbi:MAG TPA: acyl carrier protein [Bacilli bacterium]|nr:MAG: Acyl carrier protein [Tenericutes bacterium ADurb.BinA124]HNZ50725.1 acyl carrier protein [Bacilli bacterium]HOH18370.1 acyl carrier protein [Bacilli bacterium]HPN60913.1 acyl carrier protein [Bacilli bacterium]HPX84841.1 acyl carrier protein [Bacilli bacterium]
MIFEKVRKLIAKELNLKEENIKLESKITEDLGADSLDAVELIMAIEDEFSVQVSDEAAQNIRTVGDIVNLLEKNK